MSQLLLIGAFSTDMATAAHMATQAGAAVKQADGIAGGLAVLRQNAGVTLILCDVAQNIAALVRALRAERIVVPVIAGGRDISGVEATAAMQAGASDVLILPPDAALLAAMLTAAANAPSGGTPSGGAPITLDPAMLALQRRAEHIAASDASVLITGESGTGKEVLARAIHRHSRRAQGPFVALNCAAIPENLLESELFGHEKGAFSGAVARRLGKFEAASGGTLLLDEISEMDIRLQAKLLRAIQEREIDRVGGAAPVRVNVRILATSNRALAAEAQAGRFREDLYFRLNVVGLRIPPLRERPADVAPLAAWFARHYAELNGLPVRPVSHSAMRRLVAHGWRGNVRELENAIHRAVLLATGEEIDGDAVELAGETPARPSGFGEARHDEADTGAQGRPFVCRRMDAVERDHILHTLSHTLGNRTHAATMLGISIRALRNKLKDYADAGICVPPPQAGVAA